VGKVREQWQLRAGCDERRIRRLDPDDGEADVG
jgi:hypothetical protein